jgi:hypothetical protein
MAPKPETIAKRRAKALEKLPAAREQLEAIENQIAAAEGGKEAARRKLGADAVNLYKGDLDKRLTEVRRYGTVHVSPLKRKRRELTKRITRLEKTANAI